MKIQYISIHEITPYENNPRKNEKAVEEVAKSIQEYGFKNPIIIDENNIILAGHTRFKASIKLGMTYVPCVQVSDLTEEQKKGYRIADNRTNQFADWDTDLLKMELSQIDLYTGFTENDLQEVFFEEVAYKEAEEKNKPTELKIKFEKPEDFRKLEDDLKELFKKYDKLNIQVYSGEI